MNNIYYDAEENRLIYLKEKADENYWSRHWRKQPNIKKIYQQKPKWIINETKRFLKKGNKIIEGGCGLGDKLFWLSKNGYEVIGVDFAIEIVQYVKANFPELEVILGDVRKTTTSN